MAKLVFSSDWHLGHNAVLDLAHRPFGDVDAMAQYFVEQTNEICQADDRLFLLGDISFRSSYDYVVAYLKQLKCKHVSLIFGNHDFKLREQWTASGLFEFCGDMFEINPKGYGYEGVGKLVLCHYPLLTWNSERYNHKQGNSLSINLHGHLHSDGIYNKQCRDEGAFRYDVGVDANGYKPVLLEEIIAFLK